MTDPGLSPSLSEPSIAPTDIERALTAQSLVKINTLPAHILGGRLRLSPSKMIAWSECKARGGELLRNPQGDSGATIYTCIGKAAHSVIEEINKGATYTAAERASVFKCKMIEECSTEDIPINFTVGFKETREILNNYAVPAGWNMLLAETKQVLSFARYDFAFIIDGLWHDTTDDSIVIVDYKTSAKAPKSNLQLLLYAWAIKVLYPDTLAGRRVRSAFHMLRTNQLVETEVTTRDIIYIDQWMSEQVELMEAMFSIEDEATVDRVFGITTGPQCRYCTKMSCPEKGIVHPGIEA